MRQYRQEKLERQLLPTGSDSKLCPAGYLCVIVLEFGAFMGFVLLAGGKASPSLIGVSSCSWGYWGLFAAFHVLMLLLLVAIAWHLKGSESCLSWSPRTSLVISVAGFASGVLGMLLLVGSGLIVGPLLLHLQVHPQVSSATALFCVFLGAFSGAIQYWMVGALNLQYALYLDVIAVMAAIIGVRVVNWAVKRWGRPSLVVLLLAGVVGASLVLVPVYDGVQIYESIQDHTFEGGFGSFC